MQRFYWESDSALSIYNRIKSIRLFSPLTEAKVMRSQCLLYENKLQQKYWEITPLQTLLLIRRPILIHSLLRLPSLKPTT
jgi:hypothetical protein